MICPACGYRNIQGTDECESCGQDLASIDGVVPKGKIEKVLMRDPVTRLGGKPPILVDETLSVTEAARKMDQEKFGCLLVTRGGRLSGILSERDILHKALGMVKDLSRLPVKDIMTPDPEVLTEDDNLAVAVNKMSVGGFRHIPLLSEGKPVGIISVRDVLHYLSRLFTVPD